MMNYLNKCYALFSKLKPKQQPNQEKDYFQLARNWADDFYVSMVAARNRWRAVSLYVLTPMILLLLICMTMLIPMQQLQPILINHYQDGYVTATPLQKHHAPKNQAEVESDIVRYVLSRESYHAFAYKTQYTLVNLLSNNEVAKQYRQAQNAANATSPISRLGENGNESVHIDHILFLDRADQSDSNENHKNLAQVTFSKTTTDKKTNHETKSHYTALISWAYYGTPDNPEQAWQNWDGFTVTNYVVQPNHKED